MDKINETLARMKELAAAASPRVEMDKDLLLAAMAQLKTPPSFRKKMKIRLFPVGEENRGPADRGRSCRRKLRPKTLILRFRRLQAY